MCMIRVFLFCLVTLQVGLVLADPKKENASFTSFKEMGQAFDEQIDVLNEFIDQAAQSSLDSFYNPKAIYDDLEANVTDANVEISVKVPNVEDSEAIRAHVNAARKSLKVIVPQKDRITKVTIENSKENSEQKVSIKKVIKQRSEQKHEGKNLQSYQMSSGKKVSYKTLPFSVDLNERTVEYKDNDLLVITLHKAQAPVVKKAQPRLIPITHK